MMRNPTFDPHRAADDAPYTFAVTDLKQYTYCPRILYYNLWLRQRRPTTYKMEAGIAAHRQATQREKRRRLRTYGLEEGERHFHVSLFDAAWGLSGEVDMVIETERELIPVDYKLSRRSGAHFKLQLAAYGRLLARHYAEPGQAVTRGFLYLIPTRRATAVTFTPGLERQLDAALAAMRAIAGEQRMPPPTSQRRRCVDCEFRRFCNDVL
jgi:CRISPR-associated exonuclease Cas4